MPRSGRFDRISFLSLALKNILLFAICGLFLCGLPMAAQERPQANQKASQPQIASEPSSLTIPAGTRIALALTHPVQSRTLHRGDDVYAQVTAPVTAENALAMPPGTYIQGKVYKLEQKSGRGELHLQSMSITFPNGYVVPVPGPVTMTSAEGYVSKDPGQSRTTTSFLLPMGGAGLGALIGHAASSSRSTVITSTLPPGCTGPPPGCLTSTLTVPPERGKGTVIGATVGGAAGFVASLAVLAGGRHFFLEVGTPVAMDLANPVPLDRDRVIDAIAKAKNQPVTVPVPPSNTSGRIGAPASATKSPWDCPVGEEYCDGRCVSIITFVSDSSNCGRCGNRCSFSESCTGGSCSCGPGYTSCMGSCASSSSFLSDTSNCGRCGNRCSIGESCTGGTCTRTFPCTPGDITCH
jgi:hypothetical protein